MFFKKKKTVVIDQKQRKCWILYIWNKRFFSDIFVCAMSSNCCKNKLYWEKKVTTGFHHSCLLSYSGQVKATLTLLIEQLHIWKPSLLYRINWRKANIWCQLKPPDWRNKCQNLSPTSKPSSPDQRYLSLPTYQQIG